MEEGGQIEPKELTDASAVLVIGICSIVFFWLFGGIMSVAMGVITLMMSQKPRAAYLLDPTLYQEKSYGQVKAGRTCAIIGLVLGGLFFFVFGIGFLLLSVALWVMALLGL